MSMQNVAAYMSTPLQHGLLFENLAADEPGVDIIQIRCRLPEAVHLAPFWQAWRQVMARHEMLRAAFRRDGNSPALLEIVAEPALPLTLQDWSASPANEWQARLQDMLLDDRRQQFSPWTPPLWRFTLIKFRPEVYAGVLTFHHAILDGRSCSLVLNEVAALYRQMVSGSPASLAPVCSYQTYASWWQRLDVQTDEHFWRQTLAGFRTPLALPEMHDQQTAGEIGASHQEEERILSPALAQALRQLAAEHALTLNVILQGAWALLLGLSSGQRDIVFAEIRSCRYNTVAGAEEVVGCCFNTLPVRIRLTHSEPLLSYLQGIRASHLARRQHQYTPLSTIQSWSQLPQGSALCTSLFAFEKRTIHSAVQQRHGLFCEATLLRKPGFPLTLYVFGEPELRLTCVYDHRRFAQTTIQRLLLHLSSLLQQMTDQPRQRLADLSVLTEAERQQILHSWNATAYPHALHRPVYRQIERSAARAPDALAIGAGACQVTYGWLNRRANQLARLLQSWSIGPEKRVGICLARSPALLIGQLAVLKAGGAFVSLDPAYPQERLRFLVQDARIEVLLTSPELQGRFAEQDVQILALDAAMERLANLAEQDLPSQVTPASMAYVIYTSGSTGQPKGVAIEHASLANLLAWHQRTYALHAGDRTTHLASPAFDASVWEIWPTLAVGASLHIPEQETVLQPQALLTWFALHAISVAFLPTPVGEAVLRIAWPQECALRALLVGGDRLGPLSLAGLPCVVSNHYGLTETTVVATWTQLSEPQQGAPPIGRPIDNLQAYILDEAMRPVPAGIVGELYLAGVGLARGYLWRPDLTAERFLPHPWSTEAGGRLYRSGDLARYRSDGQIEFLGRRDQQVKLRGYRIELGEIEATLAHYPGVARALVLLAETEQREAHLVAYLVPDPGVSLPLAEIWRFLGQRLPASMLPARMQQLDALPLTAHGKVDRQALQALPHPPTPLEIDQPRTPLEQTLSEIWAQVLGQAPPFPLHQSFFTSGGHSLLAVQVVLRINEALQVNLPLSSIFHAPTVAQMAASLQEQKAPQAEQAAAIARLDRRRSHTSKG